MARSMVLFYDDLNLENDGSGSRNGHTSRCCPGQSRHQTARAVGKNLQRETGNHRGREYSHHGGNAPALADAKTHPDDGCCSENPDRQYVSGKPPHPPTLRPRLHWSPVVSSDVGGQIMATVLVLAGRDATEVLPALGLLSHRVTTIPAEPAALVRAPSSDLVIVDATGDLAQAKALCRILTTTGISRALLVVATEGGMPAVNHEWGIDDIVLHTAGPAEVDARIRLLVSGGRKSTEPDMIASSGVVIDEVSYQAKANGRPLDLTFKEFELLRFLVAHPSRVFTREQLLSEVWGYDYFGGTRTVDVHVRRLRAKLGDMESLIGTVRNVGYRFTVPDQEPRSLEAASADAPVSPEPIR